MKNDYYESPKPSWLTKQFWRAAGADKYLLERSTYSDQIKYFCLGGIVVATGVLAALAGGYAFYVIFEPKGDALDNMLVQGGSYKDVIHLPTVIIALLFGSIWGLIIYNIDRFIVTSTGKGDGTEAITRKEFFGAIPRIVMGLIIALTISKPIEIRMFQSEIEAEISIVQKDYLNDLDSITNVSWDLKILPFKSESDSLKLAVESQRIDLNQQRRRLEDEAAGKLPPSPPGRGPAWQDKKENLDKMEAEYNIMKVSSEKRITYLDTIITNYEASKKIEFQENVKKKYSKDGLLLRIQLAHEIAGFWISLFITLLFVVIELTPIFFKMMLVKGPYDYMDENVKELSRAELGIEIEYNFYKDGEGIEKHKVTNHAADVLKNEKKALLAAQDELNKKIIEEWKKREIKKIEDNPDDYINNVS